MHHSTHHDQMLFQHHNVESGCDNRIPIYKKYDLEDYDDDSYERNTFKSKPYGMGGGYATSQSTNSGRSAFGNMGNTPGTKSYGGTATSSCVAKPKAVVKPKVAPVSAQPYIIKQGLNGLSKGVQGVGEKPAYDVGDRVKHIKFGEGTVKAMTKGARDYEVTVDFDGAGPKIMYAAFAKLQKME